MTDEAILLKRLHEILLILHPGTTPHDDMVCHKSDLSCRERRHTLCTVARSTARNKTLPLTLAHSHSSLIQAAINITQQTQSESNSHTEHCKCQADRSRFCRWGRSPSDVNQIRCRCSWINDLHQWRALTVNILVTDPTPPRRTVYSVFALQIPPSRARCGGGGKKMKNAQCSTGLYPSLLAAGNQHHTTKRGRARPRNTAGFSTYFAFQAGKGREGLLGETDRAAFIELLQS